VSLRGQRTTFSLAQLYRSCTEKSCGLGGTSQHTSWQQRNRFPAAAPLVLLPGAIWRRIVAPVPFVALPDSHGRTYRAAASKTPSTFRIPQDFSRANTNTRFSVTLQKRIPQGSCDRRNEAQDVPKSCFVASGARRAGNLNLDPASLKTLPGRSG
jgi:hypothetical protein